MSELDDRLAAFDERMKGREPKNEEAEKQRQEELRQAYLKRTGRTELKP